MATYRFIEPLNGLPASNGTMTYATSAGVPVPFPLGLIAGAVDPTYGYAEFMLVAGSSASAPAAGDGVLIGGNNQVAQLVSGNTASRGPVGIAPAAISGTNVVGWVQIYGVADYCNLGTQGTTAAGMPIVIGSTAGRLQTTAGATGYLINGLYVSQYSTTANSNSGILQMFYPVYDARNQ